MRSSSSIYIMRLKPGDDVKTSLEKFAKDHQLKAAIVVTCVGSLREFNLRFANQSAGRSGSGHFEILSLSGTLSADTVHLHICLADHTGATLGGHLLENNIVYTTAEIAVAELTELQFTRVHDPASGYPELVVNRK